MSPAGGVVSLVLSPLPDAMVLEEVTPLPDHFGYMGCLLRATKWTAKGVCTLYQWRSFYHMWRNSLEFCCFSSLIKDGPQGLGTSYLSCPKLRSRSSPTNMLFHSHPDLRQEGSHFSSCMGHVLASPVTVFSKADTMILSKYYLDSTTHFLMFIQ